MVVLVRIPVRLLGSLFILYTSDVWPSITNKMLLYTDAISLYADILSLATSQIVANNLTVDLIIIQPCSRWGTKLN